MNIREWRSRQCAVSEKKETRNRIAHQTLGNVVRGDWIIRIRFFLWYSDERVAAAAFIRYCWKCRIFSSSGWSSSTSITPASTFKVNSFHHFTHFHYNWGEPETSRWVDLLESDAKKSEKRKFTSKNTRYWIMEMQCTWKVAKNHYFWGYCAWHWGMFRNNLESNLIKSTILSFNKYWNLSKSDQRQKFSITKQHISYKQNAQACQISHYSNNFKCIALWFDNLFNRENKQLFFQKVVFVVPNHFLCLT